MIANKLSAAGFAQIILRAVVFFTVSYYLGAVAVGAKEFYAD